VSRRAVLTDAMKAEITRLRRSDPKQYSYNALARMFGCSVAAVHLFFNPDAAARYNEAKKQAYADCRYRYRDKRRKRDRTFDRSESVDRTVGERPDPAEVLRMLAAIPPDTRDLTARLCGDPLPTRSALYQKMQGASA
jgi:hypothetical protein